MNKRKLGAEKECIAAAYLTAQGFRILAKNFYTVRGELDLIAEDQAYLVFVEVKYRKDTRYGHPAEAVGFAKQKRMAAAANYYLKKENISPKTAIRFDVVELLGDEIRLIKNAFEA